MVAVDDQPEAVLLADHGGDLACVRHLGVNLLFGDHDAAAAGNPPLHCDGGRGQWGRTGQADALKAVPVAGRDRARKAPLPVRGASTATWHRASHRLGHLPLDRLMNAARNKQETQRWTAVVDGKRLRQLRRQRGLAPGRAGGPGRNQPAHSVQAGAPAERLLPYPHPRQAGRRPWRRAIFDRTQHGHR